MPGAVLDCRDTSVNVTDRVPADGTPFLAGEADSKQAHKEINKLITDWNEDRKKQNDEKGGATLDRVHKGGLLECRPKQRPE